MKAKILNSFDDLTTNQLTVGLGYESYAEPKVTIYSSLNTIHLECSQPELLGDKLDIYNLSGQQIITSNIEQTQLNSINADIPPGIYLCKFQLDGSAKTRRIVFID